MLRKIHIKNADFTELNILLNKRQNSTTNIAGIVTDIIADIAENGDEALFKYSKKFDNISLNTKNISVSKEEITQAIADCDDKIIDSLKFAAKRIRLFHEKQMPKSLDYTDEVGVRLGFRWSAIASVGIYVPGGKASYPSSVLMNAVPAKVAGVERLAMMVPFPNGKVNPSVLVAAKIAGIDEIYKIGGSQAIAALSYGTNSIRPVYKIIGPGNSFVAEAKRQLFGKIGIDMIAGASEILVVSDDKNPPINIAWDLLSQAEHDPQAQAILVTDSEEFADMVNEAIKEIFKNYTRREIAEQSLHDFGAIIILSNLDDAPEIIDHIAPEHLELAIDNPYDMADKIQNAGAIFVGRFTPEAIGDYTAGSSHVLPTSSTAKFSSGLSVFDFIKKTSIIGCSEESMNILSEATISLAENEGLPAHAMSIAVRRKNL